MIIFPAVDIQHGKCVRLKQGIAEESTVFSEDPLDVAKKWQELGSKWLHLIDLDGAFSGKAVNIKLINKICSSLNIPIQLGGGIRDIETAKEYIDAGVSRLIIGTMALEHPDTFENLCKKFPNKIGVSLDTYGDELKTKGWVKSTGLTIDDVLVRLTNQGASFIIHTDISRDGMQSGLNINLLEQLLLKSSLPIIAAGGVSTIDDIKNAYHLTKIGKFEGVITGKAIYEKTLDLQEALLWISKQS